METNNENKALKKFMDNDLVDQLFQRRPEENEREIDLKDFDSLEEFYSAYAKERPKRISLSKGHDFTLIVLDNMREMVEAMKEMATKPQEINITIPEIKPPIVNVKAPIVRVEASKDTGNILSAIKSLVGELKRSNKAGPPKVEVNVESELIMPDHEEVIEKVVHRDGLNRIQKTVATKKIIKK